LKAFAARDRQLIFRQTMLHLSHQPARPTKRRKLMSPNPFAEWELRLGDFRVYYTPALHNFLQFQAAAR
jgi:hypothetical protein